MKIGNSIALIVAIIFFNHVQAMEIQKESLFVPGKLGSISLHHSEDGFKIKKNSKTG